MGLMDIVEFVEKVCEFSLTDFQKVLILNAGAFVVVHNHPSGDPTPSKLDIDAAKTIDEIGQLIDIPMKDFMMIGSETYYSVKENGDI